MKADSKKRGKLIVLEGIDGAGKTFQLCGLMDYIMKKGFDVKDDYEPTDGPWGTMVRRASLSPKGRLLLSVKQEANALLVDRKKHVDEFINPVLATGCWVVLDRYYLSMMAYQGAKGLDVDEIRQMNEGFAPKPDLVLLLELPVDVAIKRIEESRGRKTGFETEALLSRCAEIYAEMDMPFIRRIDATQSPEKVQEEIRKAVDELLKNEKD